MSPYVLEILSAEMHAFCLALRLSCESIEADLAALQRDLLQLRHQLAARGLEET